MKYRLKDRELQKKLDELSGGQFSEQLWAAYPQRLLRMPPIDIVTVDFGGSFNGDNSCPARFTLRLKPEEIEEAPEYNPHGWNDFPKVTPPYDVLMRCEEDTEDGTEHLCMKFVRDEDGGHWTDENGMGVWNCTRFRPWED